MDKLVQITTEMSPWIKLEYVKGATIWSWGGEGLQILSRQIIYFQREHGRKIYFRVYLGQNLYFHPQQNFEKAKKKKN